jgi:hypothetical protein
MILFFDLRKKAGLVTAPAPLLFEEYCSARPGAPWEIRRAARRSVAQSAEEDRVLYLYTFKRCKSSHGDASLFLIEANSSFYRSPLDLCTCLM